MEVTLKLFCRGTKQERWLHNYSFPSPASLASSPPNWGPLQGRSGHNNSREYVLLLHGWPRGCQLAAGDLGVCPAPVLSCPISQPCWSWRQGLVPATSPEQMLPKIPSFVQSLKKARGVARSVGNLSSLCKFVSNFSSPAHRSVMDKHPNRRKTWNKGALLSLMKMHRHWAWFKDH